MIDPILLRRLLDEGLEVELRLRGSSMSPWLQSGDTVVLAPLAGRPIGLGDVVAIRRGAPRTEGGERWILVHRVVGRRDALLLTRGDAGDRPDEPTAPEDVVARAVAWKRRGRRRRLGLGPERHLIAWLSRRGVLAAARALWRTQGPHRRP